MLCETCKTTELSNDIGSQNKSHHYRYTYKQ